jgi:hypothetical protein
MPAVAMTVVMALASAMAMTVVMARATGSASVVHGGDR